MTVAYSPNIVTDGLIMHLDAANQRSYSGSGSTWTDLTGVNNATLTNNPTYSTNNKGEFTFNGVSQYATVTTVTGINAPIGAHSIEMVVKFGEVPTTRQWLLLLGLTNTGSHHWLYKASTGVLSIGVFNATQINSLVPTPGEWVHLCATVSENGLYVYKNGSLHESNVMSTSLSIPATSAPLTIAEAKAGEAYFAGTVGSVKIYNRMLLESEVTQNFTAIRGRYSL